MHYDRPNYNRGGSISLKKKKKKEEENMLLINVSVQGYGNAVLTALCVKTPIQGNDHKDGIIESYHT